MVSQSELYYYPTECAATHAPALRSKTQKPFSVLLRQNVQRLRGAENGFFDRTFFKL